MSYGGIPIYVLPMTWPLRQATALHTTPGATGAVGILGDAGSAAAARASAWCRM